MPEHYIDCSESIVLDCPCGDDWRSRNAIFGCQCGEKLTLEDRISEEALKIKELLRNLEATHS